ncbi:hypothetical protein [Nocardia rhizosphaerihabitans]|uniref:Uncharacterized protein n=1 Tax=Nocardia rhizosphaerihabitans TaxID=1691570 RepID=A0ABQ2KVD9_9NOCA|nr:hypothetical protein [Nocardia rhizosphaerihabitans]GGN92820.1 hypothetical protein GCM10011610_54210 [Nocardia rhizosphaerihabitans]
MADPITALISAFQEDIVRIVKAVAVGLAVAAATVVGAGSVAAEPEQKENIYIDVNVLGCSFGAGLGGDVLVALGGGSGSSALVSSSLAARMRAAGCLPQL